MLPFSQFADALSPFEIFSKSQSIFEAIPLALSSISELFYGYFCQNDTRNTQIPFTERKSSLLFQHGGRSARINYSNLPTLVDCGRNSESEKKCKQKKLPEKNGFLIFPKLHI